MKAAGNCLLVVLATLQVVAYGATKRVYENIQDDRFWFQTVIISEAEFVLPELERIAREFIGNGQGRVLTVQSVYTTIRAAAAAGAANPQSYQSWRSYYDEASKWPSEAAQVIMIHGNAVLRVRHKDGTLNRRVLAGRDPLRVRSDGISFELLDVKPRIGTQFDRCGGARSLSVILFLKTEAKLTLALCESTAAELADRIDAPQVHVGFRNDHWFVAGSGFPIVHPFSRDTTPLSEEAYYKSLEFSCAVFCHGRPSCGQVTGPPLQPPRKRQR